MKSLFLSHRLSLLDDIERELPMLAVGTTFVICTTLAVYLYAAI